MTDATMSLAGKRVIVIGGASGIGFAVAQRASGLGADVVIASSNAVNVDAAVQRLPGAIGHTVDLRDEMGVADFFEGVGAHDHLAITAGDWGGNMFSATKDLDLVAARDGFEVRFWGALGAAKHASHKISPEGSITLTGGMMAHRPTKGAPLATAMGGAVEYLARGLAADLAPVRVNAVSPGMILTEHVLGMPAGVLEGYVSRLPIPRGASPDEAAMAYIYLMMNTYVTGQVMPVDGGGLLV